MVVLEERGLRNHHGVTQATEMGSVFNFFGENVTGVDDARNMGDTYVPSLMSFPDLVFV